MAALLREFPDLRVTFNLVPSLLVQLQAFARGDARDRHLEHRPPPGRSTSAPEDARFCLDEFFHAHHGRMVAPHARYRELFERRQQARAGGAGVHRRRTARSAGVAQAGVGGSVLRGRPAHRGAATGRAAASPRPTRPSLREVEIEILRRVVPEYRAARERGPGGALHLAVLPRHPAAAVRRRRLPRHASRSGRRRRNRSATRATRSTSWSEAWRCTRACSASVRWACGRPKAPCPTRWRGVVRAGRVLVDGHRRGDPRALARPDVPPRLGRRRAPCRGALSPVSGRRGKGGRSRARFRDHALSDLIGFTYASWPAEDAAHDFVRRVAAAGASAAARGVEDPVVFVILDGENAWEHFEGQGRPFLRALYRELTTHPEVRTVTMREACGIPRAPARASASGLVDPQRLLHLGRARGRPPRLGPAGAGPQAPRRAARRPARPGPSPGIAAGGRGQRLVLVVRRRPFLGSRPGLRPAVPPPREPRLPGDGRPRAGGALDLEHHHRRGDPPDLAVGPPVADARRRRLQLLRVDGRGMVRHPRRGGRDAPGEPGLAADPGHPLRIRHGDTCISARCPRPAEPSWQGRNWSSRFPTRDLHLVVGAIRPASKPGMDAGNRRDCPTAAVPAWAARWNCRSRWPRSGAGESHVRLALALRDAAGADFRSWTATLTGPGVVRPGHWRA